MILTTVRYASNLLSKKSPNTYRQIVRPKVLHSRFTSTNSNVLSSFVWYEGLLWGFGLGIGFSITENLYEIYFKVQKVVDNTKAAIQDVKTYAKDTKQEVKGIIENTHGDHHEMADRLVDLSKEKKRRWQARKDVHPDSEDEVSSA
ncbi:hypothetical protein E4T56_gene5115 [Termitomyces sp. T112]|nr:hypothetical protein E4T56_gene5115 [Termitomyces sp. T112]